MASDSPATLYVGINRTVLALDATTGMARWRTELPGTPLFGGFVTIHLNGEHVYAAAAGELSCLDAATGAMVWH
nr:PQQ-binding-like beta-propeller repeat protein [Candidatus Eremiobacteraeota bacterium]